MCPNKFLVDQTCEQAKQFGIKFCRVDANNQLPQDFLDSKSILITHVQMLFNGLSKFGIKQHSIVIESIVLDDSHACIDTIEDSFTVKIERGEDLYNELFTLFESDLEEQGQATTEEIRQKEFTAFLPVPYWAWLSKLDTVIELLVKNKEKNFLRFTWELIKDIIKDCQCIVSGSSIEITPYLNPIDVFASFSKCNHRVFMSATTNNDAFFVKGLSVNKEVIRNPLRFVDEKWSGEKLILLPYIMHTNLDHQTILNFFGKSTNKDFGIVALTPSQRDAQYWKDSGALIPDSTTKIEDVIKRLKEKQFGQTIALANRYDGIDLPDDACRILILDSKPFATSLKDRLQEYYREDSKVVDIKIAQKIEQGLGRAVRGEKDYCVIIITGMDLISILRTKKLRNYFSAQTNKQIDIGLEAGQFAVEQDTTNDVLELLKNIIYVSLKRDEKWKEYYIQEMNQIIENKQDLELLEVLQLEKKAEEMHRNGQHSEAVNIVQAIIDKYVDMNDKAAKGYYLQEMARYSHSQKSISNNYQINAYKTHRILLRPTTGIEFNKLLINKRRTENILDWLKQFENYSELELKVDEIFTNLSFGIKADKFEKAIHELGISLGFACERPDKELKRGPDNLWNIQDDIYFLIECKNEVREDRGEIIKSETGQLNNACAWFKTNYPSTKVKNILIIPTRMISASTGFNEEVEILRKKGLNALKNNFRAFFKDFSGYDLKNLTESEINKKINVHKLTVEDLQTLYTESSIQKKL